MDKACWVMEKYFLETRVSGGKQVTQTEWLSQNVKGILGPALGLAGPVSLLLCRPHSLLPTLYTRVE
jgi:hypothetical protein